VIVTSTKTPAPAPTVAGHQEVVPAAARIAATTLAVQPATVLFHLPAVRSDEASQAIEATRQLTMWLTQPQPDK
jgi:hypothetical protein